MNQKIAIIGGGLFGITVYIVLKKNGYDCTLFEKKDDILKGASTNNLNRVHFGYHYPRDSETAKQSLKGYKSFKKFYSKSIFSKFDNYYFISKKSKVNFEDYITFCKVNNLKYKIVNLKRFPFFTKNITGGIKVNEPIYDWLQIKKQIKNKIDNFVTNKIKLNETVIKINIKKNFELKTNKKNYNFDKIIDASYEGSNKLANNSFKQQKLLYQITAIFEFASKDFKKMGLALMDGNFFSFLPKGDSSKHILYHVSHSVLKRKKSKFFPKNWENIKISNENLKSKSLKIIEDIKKYFPNMKIKLLNNIYLSNRVLPINQKKTDKRVSKVVNHDNKYFKIYSAKVDHCVDVAYEVLGNLKKTKTK
tara:strand:- start:118 stop:1206 length:1089 start_codon:yes stop_codon:yes gene_type:complete